MSAPAGFVRRFVLRPATVLSLFVFAAVVWGVILWRQQHIAPVLQHLDAGREYARLGQAERAEREWKEAVRLDPNNLVAWELLGELYYSTDNGLAGADAYRQLLRLKAGQPHLHSRLAISLLRAGDEKNSYTEALEELKHDPNDPDALMVAALLSSNMGELEQERQYLQRLILLDPDDLYLLTLLAENLTYSHDYANARPVLDHMLALDPNNAVAYALRGMGWFDEDPSPQGQARAETDLLKALKANPLTPFPRLYLGKIYRRRGDMKAALFQLEEAQRLLPNKMDINFELAAAYQQAGQPEKAAQARARFEEVRRTVTLKNSLKKKCAVNPDNFEDHLQLGLLSLKDGDFHMARAYLGKAHLLRPEDPGTNAAIQQLMRLSGVSPDTKPGVSAVTHKAFSDSGGL